MFMIIMPCRIPRIRNDIQEECEWVFLQNCQYMCIQEMFKTLMQEYKKPECVIDKSQIVFDMEKKSQMSYQ